MTTLGRGYLIYHSHLCPKRLQKYLASFHNLIYQALLARGKDGNYRVIILFSLY